MEKLFDSVDFDDAFLLMLLFFGEDKVGDFIDTLSEDQQDGQPFVDAAKNFFLGTLYTKEDDLSYAVDRILSDIDFSRDEAKALIRNSPLHQTLSQQLNDNWFDTASKSDIQDIATNVLVELEEDFIARRDIRREYLRGLPEVYQQKLSRKSSLRNLHSKIHSSQPFDEWLDSDYFKWLRNKNAPINDAKIVRFLDSIKPSTIIDLKFLNKAERQKAYDEMVRRFRVTIGDLAITRRFKINYRVAGVWKSRTLTPEVWNDLMNSLDKDEFIYGDEIYEHSEIEFSDCSETGIYKLIYFDAISFEPLRQSGNTRKDNRDSFFPYLNKTDLDLSRYQIFDTLVDEKGHQRKELRDSCFVYALIQAGVDKETLNKIRIRIHIRKLGLSKLDAICEEFNLHVVVHDLEDTNKHTIIRVNGKNYFGTPNGKHIELNSYKGHYFLEEKTKYTSYYIKHKYLLKEDVPKLYFNKFYEGGRWRTKNQPKFFISSSALIKLLFENGDFEPITYDNARILSTILYKDIPLEITNLEYSEKHCLRLMKPKVDPKNNPIKFTYFYADFEADVSKTPHKCFMCCLSSIDGEIQETFTGESCDVEFLQFVSRYENPCIYFHNLKYDFSFLAKYGMKKSIQKGSRLMRAVLEYNGTEIFFRDTVPILSCKLSDLPAMFNLKGIQKELFPYKYYTFERLEKGLGIIHEAGRQEDIPWNDSDYETFRANIKKIPNCLVGEDYFDMYTYAEFYCKQDVNILRQAFNQFAEDFKKEFSIDPFDFISISSLANEVFKQNVYYPNGNLYEVGGHVREFLAQAVYGGRCMCAYNKKWHIKDIPISDYDAVSLYPSAMSRLYTVEGKPQVLNKVFANNLTTIPEELSKYSAYVIEIRITNVGKHYPFPLIVQKTKNGNLYDDTNISPENPVQLVVDNIYLEDLVKFQRITFDIIRGYTWSGNKDYRIRDVITQIFQKRLEYKKQNNPLQILYKLIMNSCYGKCIEKPVTKDCSYVKDYDKITKTQSYNVYRRYLEKHYDEIIEDVEIGSSVHEIKRLRPTNTHFNNSLLGIQILSMSKRIMNEVMCLAYDIGCHIFYQDTDSMHIYKADLERLEKAYSDLYHRELKGKNMCQFHSDFPEVKGGTPGEVPYAIESIFLMKKLYIDKLTDSSGNIDYMVRGKGLTQACIKITAQRYADAGDSGGLMNLYKAIYNGATVSFNLAEGSPSFNFAKDFTVSSNKDFIRKVSTGYSEGSLESYFRKL